LVRLLIAVNEAVRFTEVETGISSILGGAIAYAPPWDTGGSPVPSVRGHVRAWLAPDERAEHAPSGSPMPSAGDAPAGVCAWFDRDESAQVFGTRRSWTAPNCCVATADEISFEFAKRALTALQ
jgi:hypothetical protein